MVHPFVHTVATHMPLYLYLILALQSPPITHVAAVSGAVHHSSINSEGNQVISNLHYIDTPASSSVARFFSFFIFPAMGYLRLMYLALSYTGVLAYLDRVYSAQV